MAAMDYVTELCAKLPQSDSRRERTVEALLKYSSQIFDWFSCIFQMTPQFTPFVYETGGMTVNNVCSTLNAMMQLDSRLAECAIKSLSASFVALRLWTLRTPGPEPTKLMIPPGSSSLELYATYALMEQGASVLESGMKAPWIVDRFADAFIERLDVVDSLPIIGRDSPELAEAERHLNICFIVLRLLCKNSALVHAALWRRNYIVRWSRTLLKMMPYLERPNALRLCAQILQVATECNGNTVNAVLDYIKSGAFLAVLQTLRSVKSFEGLVLQATTIIFYRMNKYCYRTRTAKAAHRVLETHSDLAGRLVAQQSPVSLLFDQMSSSARLFTFWLRMQASNTVCDNALHLHGEDVNPFDYPQTCSKCHLVTYCSYECQKEDWQRRHRSECSIMRRSHLGRNKAQRRYHYTCRATQLEVVLNTITPSYSIEEMENARKKHGAYITVFDTTKDPPERYIYKLTINTYLRKRLQGDCAAMEKRVDGLVREYATALATMKSGKDDKGKEKENLSGRDRKEGEGEDGDVWLVDAGFANGCDEMVALLMKIEKVKGRWKVVESVPRVLSHARYGLFPDCESIALGNS
ncbi:hypothetical protein BKA70DRAFT_1330593 [Coprinopsis sp. MPI-PUGE-AT-0042]|nr:hypothetical protein BKA70DRAFT_1330593 [Coprinopsis sp. MPI-PUGE-AT-0042]